jgi:very-short-patch-repair endonuclease
MGNPHRIARFASRQHGVFSAAQSRLAGFDKNAVARRLASGEWIQLDYRVFALPSAPATWERQMWVALLSRPRAVVGGRSAAYLQGMRGISRSKPVIVVPGSANARSEIARVVRSEHFDELELVEIRGFTVTSVAETLLCLAGDLSKDRLEELVDDLMLSGQVEPAQLMPVVERETGRRRRGIASYRELVELRLPYAPQHDASYLERVLVRLLTKARLPDWTREHPFTVDDRGCRVDVYIPSWRLVIEADGRNFHARRLAFEADRRRDNQLAMRGIQVIRLTYEMLTKDPSGCLETILAVGLVRSA